MVPDSERERDIFGRGWTPSPRARSAVLVVAGVALVVNPLVGGLPDAVGLTGNAEYTAVEVAPTADGEGLRYPGGDVDGRAPGSLVRQAGGLERVDCFPFTDAGCALERQLLDGNLTVDAVDVGWHGYTHHGRFYERVRRENGDDVTLALRPVSASTVLANVSAPVAEQPDSVRNAVRTAVETGSVRTDPTSLLGGEVVERGGDYYVLVRTGGPRDDGPPGPLYSAASAGLGVVLVQRGRRSRRGDA